VCCFDTFRFSEGKELKEQIRMRNTLLLFVFTLYFVINTSAQCPGTGYFTGNLITCTSSYLSGDGNDIGASIRILDNYDVVVSGMFHELPAAQNNYTYLNANTGSQGAVCIFNPSGTVLKTIVRLGDMVDDMDVDRSTNEILVYGSFGLVKLNADGSQLLWHKSGGTVGQASQTPIYSSGRRVAVAQNGDIVILGNSGTASACDGFVHVYDADGNDISAGLFTIHRTDIGGGTYNEKWEDIAIDSQTKQVFVTGTAQRCTNFQSSFLMAYSYHDTIFGHKQWQSFTLWCSGATNYNLTADARGKRVVFKNNELLFVGHADGGNNLFTKKVNDYDTNEPNLIQIDDWNNGAGFGSGKIAYFARLNQLNGEVIKSQFQFSSTGVNQAKSFEILSITSTNDGQIIVGGVSQKDMPLRNALQINGIPVGARVDNESALIGVSNDFTQRNLVSTFTGTQQAASSKIVSIDAHNGVFALLGETEGDIMTVFPIDPTRNNGTAVFYSVFGKDTTLSVQSYMESTPKGIHAFPNPTCGELHIKMPENQQYTNAKLQVFDIAGNMIISKETINTHHEIIHLPTSGVFVVKVLTDSVIDTKKIIVVD
jgi:hypothetical protein